MAPSVLGHVGILLIQHAYYCIIASKLEELLGKSNLAMTPIFLWVRWDISTDHVSKQLNACVVACRKQAVLSSELRYVVQCFNVNLTTFLCISQD